MDISPKIDLARIRDKQNRFQLSFLIWLFFSSILTVGVYFRIRYLYHMDIPAHICAGLVIAMIIFKTVKVKNAKKALLLALIPFVSWELIEFMISHSALATHLHGLFRENVFNKIQDVTMDTLGFVFYMVFTRKKF